MYKYEYVKVTYASGLSAIRYDDMPNIKNYRSIIDKKAEEGWRFVGYVPTKQQGYGYLKEIDLIFEKEI